MAQKFQKIVLLISSLVFLAGCGPANEAQQDSRSLTDIIESGTLRVLTRNAPTTWYIGRDGEPMGPEYDMVEAFASFIDVEVEYIVKDSIAEIIAGIENAEGDLATAGLTITDERQERFRFGPAYQDVTQQVVCRRDNIQPEDLGELVGVDIKVSSESSYSERLEVIQSEYPELTWQEAEGESTESMLNAVWQREIDCTVADSNIVDLNRRYFPELSAPINLNRAESLGWIMSVDRNDLQNEIEEWFGPYQESGRLAVLQDRYYGFVEVFDYVDTRRFINRIKERYPKYREYFKQAAAEYGLSYLLLSAQSYQESHWRANARSPTGVRGLMMLTLNTAKAMGVDNRLDPKQSIFGGAKYLARLKRDRFSDEVKDPDRTWLALAAYNIGRGHLHDAQTLAREMDLNPNLWSDIKQVLPLLAEKRYYNRLRYGYARGTEPVRYVQQIREYEHILENEQQ